VKSREIKNKKKGRKMRWRREEGMKRNVNSLQGNLGGRENLGGKKDNA